MKFKGMSLIELVIVLGILSMVIACSTYNYFNIYNNCSNSNSIDFCNNYILHSLENSALYCKGKNEWGYILFKEDNEMNFYCDNKKIEIYKIPSGFKFENRDEFGKMISIDNFGTIRKECTIKYNDKKGETHRITIRVGTRYVQIKKE